MSRSNYTLFVSSSGAWKIGCLQASDSRVIPLEHIDGNPLPSIASRLYRTLLSEGYAGEGVCLAVPSEWCLAASVGVGDLPHKDRHALMLYRLEEKLPLPAEELVIDFAPGPDRVLGVAAAIDRLKPVVEALESAGIAVSQVCPSSILSLQAAAAANPEGDVFLLGSGGAADVFGVTGGRAYSWHYLPDCRSALPQALRWHALEAATPRQIVGCGITDTEIDRIKRLSAVKSLSTLEKPLLDLAIATGDAILRGRSGGWVDLRRDGLAVHDPLRQIRTPLNWAIAAMLVFAVAVAGAMLWRAREYRRWADAAAAQQAIIFQRAFPGRRLPANVKSRLASEERRLRGTSGEAGRLPDHLSALMLMYDTFRALPHDVRFRLLELRFAGERLDLEGQARSHVDAERIASALGRVDSLQVDAPHSEQRADGSVGFTLSAAIKMPAATGGGMR